MIKPDNSKSKEELIEELELLRKQVNLTKRNELNYTKQLDKNELQILLKTAIELGSNIELDNVLQSSADKITSLANIDTSAIYLVQNKTIYLGATTPPLPPDMPEEFRFADIQNHPHIKKAIESREIIEVADSRVEEFSKEEKLIAEQRGLKSIWYIPIATSIEVIGVFIVASQNESRSCSEEELNLFRALSNIVAISLQNSLLHKNLEEKNEELSTTLLSIGDSVISTDFEGKVVLMNSNAERMCGYSLDEAKGKYLHKIFNIINSKTRDKVEDPVSKVIKDGKRINLANHTVLISHNGDEFQIADSAAPIFDRNGRITGIVLVFADVTEDYKLREALKQSEKNLVKAEVMGGFGNWELDLAKGTIIGSVGACEIYNVEQKGFDLQLIQKIPLPEYRPLLDQALKELISQNKPYDIEFKIRRNDGQIKWIHSTAVYDQEKKKVFGILHDITERKNASEALIKSEQKYREFFIKDLTGDFLSTVEGEIVDCNPALLKILGFPTIESVRDYSAKKLYVQPSVRENLIELLETQKEITDYEIEMYRYDGSQITVLENIIGIFNENNELIQLRSYLFDISDRKKAENALIAAKEKAESADRMKTEFLAQMSHEIRSPLNAVLSFTSLIREMTSEHNSEDMDLCFSSIHSASKRIVSTIDSILNMSDLQLGSYQIVKRDVDIVRIFNNLVNEYKSMAKNKKLELRFNSDVQEKIVKIDDYALSQILTNLIDNSIKYTDSGYVEINLNDNHKLSFEVKDSGIGISEKFLPNLFNPFTQEEQGYTRSYDGNGLGLALVKKYCEMIDACISVKSKKNEGTSFFVELSNSNE